MSGNDAESHCYAIRLLNPYQGVAQIVEVDGARAVSNDGVKWRLQLRNAIYKSPWSSLAVAETDRRFFIYGVWSQQLGLVRTPIHPSLYQDHVEATAQELIQAISRYQGNVPFPLRDTLELWLIKPSSRPVALLASSLPRATPPELHSLLWQPSPNTDRPFVSEAYRDILDRASINSPAQDLLLDLVNRRCKPPLQALWIERDANGDGTILQDHKGKRQRTPEHLPAQAFPPCLLTEDWQSAQTGQLVKDYLNWQAPMLLMLPLPPEHRRNLELQAQQRPLSVHTYHRLYPDITDKTLLNKILVEAVMRKATD